MAKRDPKQPRYVIQVEPERSRFSGYRWTLLLFGIVVLVMLVVTNLGGR